MTQEQFETARAMRSDEFAACCEADPDFEVEFYAWIDYFTVLRLEAESKDRLANGAQRLGGA